MSKLGKNRSSGGDLEALLKASSPAIVARYIMHIVLCIAALVLGFSISREAVLVVVSFRLPYGSLFVKTTTRPDGHEVAIISFPRMKQTRALSRSDFTFSHLMDARTEVTVPSGTKVSVSSLGNNAQARAFSEAKVVVQKRRPSIYSSRLERAPRSRVHVGRHKILIRPLPHPNPLQVVAAQNLMMLIQEEQQHLQIPKERRRLLVITPTSSETFRLAGLTCLMHSLRLIRGSLTWIVVESGNASEETAAFLAFSKLPFHHFGVPAAHGDSTAAMITEALRYIHNQRLEGIIVFAVENIVYNLDFFHEVQKVKWIGAFTRSSPASSTMQGCTSDACENCDKLVNPIFGLNNTSEVFASSDNSCNNASINAVCWYPLRDAVRSRDSPFIESADWSALALNARLLWDDQIVPWVKSWRELFEGNQSLIKSPLDLVKNPMQIEPLERCG